MPLYSFQVKDGGGGYLLALDNDDAAFQFAKDHESIVKAVNEQTKEVVYRPMNELIKRFCDASNRASQAFREFTEITKNENNQD